MKKFLVPFSYLFHPLFIPLYATFFYVFANHSTQITKEKLLIFLQVFVVTVVLPLLVFYLLKSLGTISSMMAPKISERKLPLVIQSFLLILLVKKGITVERYPEFHFFFLGALLSTLLALVLLFLKTKASLHMMGISALTLFVLGLSMHFQTQNTYWISFFILMNGVVASSRLEMKAHSPYELSIGFLIGSVPQILLLYVWL
ncbi:hypothetical protein FFWV33_02825 [Flavobacterium faecale]|uniref:Transmembrane protein n=1 Tax=Flavobacterium faecale TaxID=1355330 RepID=A0A2S1L9V6_9FLAO|nr:hypothetical protein [Flavobacterium faecale]AWG20539.1 hypothetical protein FFWV33_02825 [Flavobacterium faecale]